MTRRLQSTAWSSRRRKALLLLLLLLLLELVADGLIIQSPAASVPPEPSLISTTHGGTNATFSFTDGQGGVTFICQFDAGPPASGCASPISFHGLAPGIHTFLVQAAAGGEVSLPAIFRWRVHTTRPVVGAHNRSTPTAGRPETVPFVVSGEPSAQGSQPEQSGNSGSGAAPSSPVTPSPVGPSPVTPSGVTPSPAAQSRLTPSPTPPGKTAPGPATPGPVKPAPVTPSPVIAKASPPQGLAISGDVPSTLYPGARRQPLNLTITNPNAGEVRVTSLTVTIESVTGGSNRPNACTAADFQVVQINPAAVPFTAPPGVSTIQADGVGAAHQPTIRMIDRHDFRRGDRTGNQDGCMGATVNLGYSASG